MDAMPLPPVPPPSEPPSERTKAIQAMNATLQDVTAEVRELRSLYQADHTKRESWRAAFLRAIKQFISQVTQ